MVVICPFCSVRSTFAVNRPARLSLESNDAAGLASRYGPLSRSPTRLSTLGFDPTRFQTEPPASTGPASSYRDWTCTGRRRRACDQVITAGQSPPDPWAH
jgi:hypothetical protein